MATELYERMIAFDHHDADRNALMRKVWDPTPWMVDAFTGRCGEAPEPRDHAMIMWCYDTFGEMSSPIHGRAGRWTRGSATINGWTWFGFATEADMNRFVERWPTPEGVKRGDGR